jgi:hypothetical protein
MARTKGSKTTCGYCYDTGHNRRTCPKLKEYIEKNPDSYSARVSKRAAEHRKVSGRRCSYCAEQGHNRATCKSIKEDTATYRQLNRKFQATMENSMMALGFGVGSIVSTARASNPDAPLKYYLIKEIKWDQINIANWYRSGMGEQEDYPVVVERIDTKGFTDYDKRWELTKHFRLPTMLTEHSGIAAPHYQHRYMKVVGPIESNLCEFNFGTDRGNDFMRHKDYKDGYASRTIEYMKKKWTGEE